MGAVLFALLLPAQGTAERPLVETSDFWREIRRPGQGRVRDLVGQGFTFLRQMAGQDAAHPMTHALLRSALLRFERALLIDPVDREALYLRAYALARFEEYEPSTGETQRRDREAIDAYLRLQTVDAHYNAGEVGFELGLLYTRIEEFPEAIAAYEYSIAHALSPRNTAVTHSNLAEARMMSLDLVGAVRDYERAIELAQGSRRPLNLGLPLFGLAVALDRLGETSEAQQRATEAVGVAGQSLDHLHEDGVSFDPASEIHYYEALGHQALAASADGEAQRRLLRAAVLSWQAYLSRAAADDPWLSLVEERLRTAQERLRAASERTSPRAGRHSRR